MWFTRTCVCDDGDDRYSKPSIERMVLEIREATPQPYKIAFVSTPSLFFSLPTQEREHCAVLDVSFVYALILSLSPKLLLLLLRNAVDAE